MCLRPRRNSNTWSLLEPTEDLQPSGAFVYCPFMKTMVVSLAVPADLRGQVAKIARRAKAKEAEVYRLAILCGLVEAEKRLMPNSGGLFPNIDPLPRAVLDRWYRSKESREWGELEAAATRAQSFPQFEE